MPIQVTRLIRSKRSSIALIVQRDGSVTVRAPLKMSAKVIDEFVQKHSKWVQKKQLELQQMMPIQLRRYEPGESFLYLGQAYPLQLVPHAKQKLILQGAFQLVRSEQSNAEMIFHGWYRKQAKKLIGERAAHFAEQFELHVERIRITSARTRWGSCSAKGALSFSWRLIMTPPDVVDYVIVHELAHTIHHNHSKRFWKLVEKWMPDYRERRKQLRQYGRAGI